MRAARLGYHKDLYFDRPYSIFILIDDLDAGVPEELEVSTHKYADDCTQSECIMKESVATCRKF